MTRSDSFRQKILVVEDDTHLAEGLELNLKLAGYEVEIAPTGIAALNLYRERRPDLIILDIMLPKMDGFTVLRHIRIQDQKLPIIILSAKSGVDDKIQGLKDGVDDYLSKPFHLKELLLRVERLLARASWNGRAPTEPEQSIYSFGPNQVNLKTYTANCPMGEINLSEQEVRLLKIFFQNKDKPLSRQELLEIGWGYSGDTSSRTVDNFIVRFRKYFEEDPKKPKFFKSLRSVGYLFTDKED
ncbi:MAG: response regulator transcription factor [Desulfatibacillaceae bacterium]|nr:response regulator transcription factor [Desulfatibacillaceae bacterium]